MAPKSAAEIAWDDKYNTLLDLFESDKLDECLEGTEKLLQENHLPRYHYIKALLLLASLIPDVEEAWAKQSEAKLLWHLLRQSNPAGEDLKTDEAMQELWEEIEEGTRELEEELGKKYGPHPGEGDAESDASPLDEE
ncbi:hypothetical protein LTR95_006757 [Oleoguttula sp. CCFEE 5521]